MANNDIHLVPIGSSAKSHLFPGDSAIPLETDVAIKTDPKCFVSKLTGTFGAGHCNIMYDIDEAMNSTWQTATFLWQYTATF